MPEQFPPQPLLRVQNLTVAFAGAHGSAPLAAVQDVSFDVAPGEILGLVGESGCGKSVTAKAIIRLLPNPPAQIAGGRIEFLGEDIIPLPEEQMRRLRGNRMAMVFQEPMTSLNPVLRVGEQIAEPLRLHRGLGTAEARNEAVRLLGLVGIPEPEQRYEQFPHEMSGGMRQRIMIAMALSCSPQLLLADEPTTALDVTVQRQILELMRGLVREFGASLVLITHDLGVVAHMAHRVAVMYAGRIVEQGPAQQVLATPQHPYTQGLLASRPGMACHDADNAGAADHGVGRKKMRLAAIAGTVPPLQNRPSGCLFHPRCTKAMPRCREELPPAFACPQPEQAGQSYGDSGEDSGGHTAACWLLER